MHVRAFARPFRLGGLKRERRSYAVAAALLASCAVPVVAQAEQDTARVALDTLRVPVTRSLVSAARAPVSLSLVTRSHIQDARAGIGLDESLASIPGLTVDNRQNFSLGSRIAIRGMGARAAFGVRGIRVLVDGVPLTMPDGQTNLTNLDLGSAGAIHVLRGPASALFGNAAGGVIAVETEPAPGARSAEARITLGDQGRSSLTRLVKAQVKVAETVGDVDYLASVSRLHADGYRDHGRARQTLVNARAGYRVGAHTRLALVLNAVDMPVAENPGALPLDSALNRPTMAWQRNVDTGSGESAKQAQLGVNLQHAGRSARTDVSAYALRRTLENPLPFAFIDLARWAGGIRAQHERRLGAFGLTGGLDVEAQSDDRFEFDNAAGQPSGTARRDQNDRVASIGPFVQARLDAGRLGLTLGARYDAVRFETVDRRDTVPLQSGERTLHAPSLMAGVVMALSQVTVFGNVATSFQTPTTTELLNAPPAPGAPCCPAGFNQELDPQRALSAELGLRGSLFDRLRYDVAAYVMDVRDALVQFQVSGVDGREFFRNAGRTRHRGIELAVDASLGDGFSAAGAYALTDVRFRDDGDSTRYEGNRVPGIAPHKLFAATTWTHDGTSITAEVRHIGGQFANDANTVEADGYTLLDLRATTALGLGAIEIAPFAALSNLLDEEYPGSLTVNAAAGRFFEPAPGFNIVIGASVRTGAWRRR
ncbi:MAG TPA: TonB-dependent receptor [Longimicrobiales bacterium]